MAREITYNNFEISLVVFMPNITTNHAITYTNQHSITLLGIHMRQSAYKRETFTFINADIKVINTILKVNRDNIQTNTIL